MPRLLKAIPAERILVVDYNGVTLEEFTNDTASSSTKEDITRDIVDVLFQLSFIVATISIKKNLKNTDLHNRNILVRRLPTPSLRTLAVWNGDGTRRYAFSYESSLLVTIVDWVLFSSDVPYSRSRSCSSRNSSNSQSGLTSAYHPPCIPFLLWQSLQYLRKFDCAARIFQELGYGVFSLLSNTKIVDVLNLKYKGPPDLPDISTDLISWNFRTYHFFIAPSQLTRSVTTSPKRPGPKRKWMGPRANAQKCRHYRALKKRKLRAESDPLLSLAVAAEILVEGPMLGEENFPNSDQINPLRIDLFCNDHYGGFKAKVCIDWSDVCGGLGVFAKAVIPKGTLISDYPGLIITKEVRDTLEDWQLSHLRRHSYLRTFVDGNRVPSPSQGVGPFINSSAGTNMTANAEFRVNRNDNSSQIYATNYIRRGQEILIDYQIGWTNPI